MATIKKQKKVSELPEASDTTGFWIFGSKTIGGVVTSVKFAFDKITPLFGVSQTIGTSTTAAPSENAVNGTFRATTFFKICPNQNDNSAFINNHVKELNIKNLPKDKNWVVSVFRLYTTEIHLSVYELKSDGTLNTNNYLSKAANYTSGTTTIKNFSIVRSRGSQTSVDADFDAVVDIAGLTPTINKESMTDTLISKPCFDSDLNPVSSIKTLRDTRTLLDYSSVDVDIPYTGINNNKYLDPSGNILYHAGFDMTDPIPVQSGVLYHIKQTGSVKAQSFGYFTAQMTTLGRGALTGDDKITMPSGCENIVLYKHQKNDQGVITTTFNYEIKKQARNILKLEDGSVSYNLDDLGGIDQLQQQINDVEIIAESAATKADGAQGAISAQQQQINTLGQQISGIAPNPIEPYYLPRPANGIVNFSVPVNCNLADVDSDTLNTQDALNEYYDWGILKLPTNYAQTGTPIRLVISCHGTGTWIDQDSYSINSVADFLLTQGFAVMDMNGIPASFVGSDGTDNGKRHYGAPFAQQSYIKGYHWILDRYNIAKDGCFIYGISMGGLSSFQVVLSGSIPVIAQGAYCPCIDLFKQAYCNPWNNGTVQRADIAQYFGFKGTAPTFTNNKPPTQAEIDYFKNNVDKVIGYSPIWKEVVGLNTNEIMSVIPATSEQSNTSEAATYNKYSRIYPVPLKIWHNLDDTTVRYRYSQYLVRMIQNAGGMAFLRTFPSGGHNAWENGADVTNIPTISGSTTTTKTSIYEFYLWIKRFL